MSVDQDNIDDLLGSLDSEDDTISQSLEAESQGDSDTLEDTANAAVNQEEADRKKEPWVDYIPAVEFKPADDLVERINDNFDLLEQTMLEKEFKLFDYVLKYGDIRYYDDFLKEVNASFRTMVRLKKRRIQGKRVVTKARDTKERYLPGTEPKKDPDLIPVEDHVSEGLDSETSGNIDGGDQATAAAEGGTTVPMASFEPSEHEAQESVQEQVQVEPDTPMEENPAEDNQASEETTGEDDLMPS